MMLRKYLFGIICLVLILSPLSIASVDAQDEPGMDLLFPDKSCGPPCWMGLIPGESTSADVEQVLGKLDNAVIEVWPFEIDDDNVIDRDTGLLVDGDYTFNWLSRYDGPSRLFYQPSSLQIRDGILDLIVLVTNQRISLREVLNRLGTPDDVQIIQVYYSVSLRLVYIDKLLEISLTSSDDCMLNGFEDDFEVTFFVYPSYENANELVETDYGLQPRILQYGASPGTMRQVPIDIFKSWLNGEEDASCYEWHNLLSETVELPEIPAREIPIEATDEPE